MLRASDLRRRWWGTFFLIGSLAMLLWGVTGLRGQLSGESFLYYWLGCISVTAVAFMIAMADFWIIRRRARQERREMVRELLKDTSELLDDDTPRCP